MRVQATKQGFYGQFREVGDIFDIAKDVDFSETWMKEEKDEASIEDESSLAVHAAAIDQDYVEEKSQAKADHHKHDAKPEHKTRKNPFKRSSSSVDL